jgi:hypothetical protein
VAQLLSRLLGAYADPAVIRRGGRLDPLGEAATWNEIARLIGRDPVDVSPARRTDFIAQPPANFADSFDEQQDLNETVLLLVNHVFPALVQDAKLKFKKDAEREEAIKKALKLSQELLLLALLYMDLNGRTFAGPLHISASQQETDEGTLTKVIEQIRKARIMRQGGEGTVGGEGKFRVYLTYNPVLFEMTHLYWPPRREKTSQFGTLLNHPEVLADIDAVGRFGDLARSLATLSVSTTSEQEVQAALQNQIYVPIEGQSVINILSNVYVNPLSKEKFDAKPQFYESFLRSWPIDGSFASPELFQEAFAQTVSDVITNPLMALSVRKDAMADALTRLSRQRSTGIRSQRRFFAGPAREQLLQLAEGKRDPLDPEDAGTETTAAARQRLRRALSDNLSALPEEQRGKEEKKALIAFQRQVPRLQEHLRRYLQRTRSGEIRLAEKTGLPVSTIVNLSLGKIQPSLREFTLIAQHTNLSGTTAGTYDPQTAASLMRSPQALRSRLLQFLEKTGVSTKDFAWRAGLQLRDVDAVLRGDRAPTRDEVQRLVAALDPSLPASGVYDPATVQALAKRYERPLPPPRSAAALDRTGLYGKAETTRSALARLDEQLRIDVPEVRKEIEKAQRALLQRIQAKGKDET